MEEYPDGYVAHNLPLLFLSGLGESVTRVDGAGQTNAWKQGHGTRIASEIPPLSESQTAILQAEFLSADATSIPWSQENLAERSSPASFRITCVGRNYELPPRKAAPPPQAPSSSPPRSPPVANSYSTELHSPLSPLSPTSPLFPDGVLTPLWIAKHQSHIPAVFVSFFGIGANPQASSSKDVQLRDEIISVRSALTKSGFKTRYAVILIGDSTLVGSSDLEERLSAIRRATALDTRSSFFFLSQAASPTETAAFVKSVLSALQPVCVEYYRDLTKHARRKKNRGYVPPATGSAARGTSQALSTPGWNVRYEFKQGVFAEFRQEMDAAERHYSMAIDELFHPEGILEHTPSWSARWEDARCLADITAIRILRCQLWYGMTTGAVQSWVNYKDRVLDLVDRRGKGSGTYGWAAWESRWAQIMAQLMERADLAAFRSNEPSGEDDYEGSAPSRRLDVYAPPEKAFAAIEALPPFQFLHHPGYWYRLSGKRARSRRRRARAIPDEDRTSPEQTPAAQIADRVRRYDTYMVPPPHEELPMSDRQEDPHFEWILELDERAATEFSARRQTRAEAQVRLDQAGLLAEQGRHRQVVNMLRPIWHETPWRTEKWWALASDLISALHNSAAVIKDEKLLIELEWERAADVLASQIPDGTTPTVSPRSSDSNEELTMDSLRRLSPIYVSFAFATAEGHVGDMMPCQVTIRSSMTPEGPLPQPTSLVFEFNGNPHSLRITHKDDGGDRQIQTIQTSEVSATSKSAAKSLVVEADLRLQPQQTWILNVSIPLRDAGSFRATDARMGLSFASHRIEYVFSRARDLETTQWWLEIEKGVTARRLPRDEPYVLNVLPKPPKVMLSIANLREQYYTNEKVLLTVDVLNEEAEPVTGSLNVELLDSVLTDLELGWEDGQGTRSSDPTTQTQKTSRKLGTIANSGQETHVLSFVAPNQALECSFSIGLVYSLASDPDTPVSKTMTLTMTFVNPFEAHHDLLPRLDNSPWPSFFSLDAQETGADTDTSGGIRQRWILASRVASFASESLVVESASLVLNNASSNITCDLNTDGMSITFPTNISPKISRGISFPLSTRKISLDDRRSSFLDLGLAIVWRRVSATSKAATTTSVLPVPKLTIPGPEPRVLCTTSPIGKERNDNDDDVDGSVTDNCVGVTYTIENPSMHFLTFTVTMEATDQFAFSGPKFRTIALTPLSRVSVHYRLLAYEGKADVVADDGEHDQEDIAEERDTGKGDRKGIWVSPSLRVVDAYFQKTLRVVDAGPGVRTDAKTGAVRVWVPER